MSDTVFLVGGILLIVPFLVEALKGKWTQAIFGYVVLFFSVRFGPLVGIVGFVFLVIAIWRAIAPATPNSVWARWFYDEQKLQGARDYHAPPEGEDSDGENSTE